MPKFLHSNDEDLSDLNRAKRAQNRDYAKQFQSQDGNHDNLGQSDDVDAIYNTLIGRLTGLQGALQDLFNTLEVGTTGNSQLFSPTFVANFQQFATRVLSEVQSIQLIMGRIKNFNSFTPPQSQELASLVSNISALNTFIEGTLPQISTYTRGGFVVNSVETYKSQIDLLLQFLEGASSNYKAVESDPTTTETRVGGAIVPAYNGEGRYGSDGYTIGNFYTYSAPRRFY